MNDITTIQNSILDCPDEDTFKRLMTLRQDLLDQEARRVFMQDFAVMQANLPTVKKGRKASFKTKKDALVQYSYVRIDDLTAALKPIIAEYGFSFMFQQKEIQDRLAVRCVVMHQSGHTEFSEMTAPIEFTDRRSPLQSIASTLTYLKRITFVSAFGISVTEDEVPDPRKLTQYYPDYQFRMNFPRWRLAVSQGRKTWAQILQHLESHNVNLTEAQRWQIESLQSENQGVLNEVQS